MDGLAEIRNAIDFLILNKRKPIRKTLLFNWTHVDWLHGVRVSDLRWLLMKNLSEKWNLSWQRGNDNPTRKDNMCDVLREQEALDIYGQCNVRSVWSENYTARYILKYVLVAFIADSVTLRLPLCRCAGCYGSALSVYTSRTDNFPRDCHIYGMFRLTCHKRSL